MSDGGARKLVIGSRESELAMVQTREVEAAVKAHFPDVEVEIKTSLSHGDEVLDRPLSELAGEDTGLFTKKLERWLLASECDVAVHSLKDMPTTLPDGLVLAAITKRAAPEDALLVHPRHKGCGGLQGLPQGAVVGTSSLRREAMVRRLRPDLRVVSIRGNLQKRYHKLIHGHEGVTFDAIVLAAAGLHRLGWDERIEAVLDPESFPYGVSQGALGIECRAGDEWVHEVVRKAVGEAASTARCLAERAMLRTLQGGCQVPIGVHTQIGADGSSLTLYGAVLSLDGQKCIQDTEEGRVEEGEEVGKRLGARLREEGAMALIGTGPPREITYGCAEDRNGE